MMDSGMDSAIIDPLDAKIMATIRTADMLLSHDDYCMNYLKRGSGRRHCKLNL
ncbi:hypothetical protein [Desulfospira joergensenii]|uniref:hypothetical protein n=1 Tax=Desulfospira joergensenii TaxID=53329 RepID=UPI0003B30F1A|nr:hypothetical protein [Desulfospira joergensenii]